MQYDRDWAGVEELVARWKGHPTRGDALNFMVLFGRGDIEKAAEFADDQLATSGWSNEDWLFNSALAHLLIDDDLYETSVRRAFLYARHDNRDYLRLLLWWRFMQHGRSQDAAALLQERLAEISPDERAKGAPRYW